MAELTPVAVAVLALLTERPMHAYEMYQTLSERHDDRVLRLSVGSIYGTVGRLQDAELVRVRGKSQVGNRPERTTYEIVDAGRAALRERVGELLRTRGTDPAALHVAIAELHHLQPSDGLDALRERRDLLAADLAEMDLLLCHAQERGVPKMYYLSGTYARAMCRAEHEWLTQLITDIESGAVAWPHP